MTEDVDRSVADLRTAIADAQDARPTPPPRKGDPPWLKIMTVVAAILVCLVVLRSQHASTAAVDAKDQTIELQADTIREQGATLHQVQESLDRFNAQDTCLAAFSRRITATQNAYITAGLGGLVSALTVDDPAARRAGVDIAKANHDRLREESTRTVAERDEYVAKGARPPCPIPTISN